MGIGFRMYMCIYVLGGPERVRVVLNSSSSSRLYTGCIRPPSDRANPIAELFLFCVMTLFIGALKELFPAVRQGSEDSWFRLVLRRRTPTIVAARVRSSKHIIGDCLLHRSRAFPSLTHGAFPTKFGVPASLTRSVALDRPPQLILPIQRRGKGTRLLSSTCIPTRTMQRPDPMARPSSKPEASSSSETRDSDYLVPAANVAQTLVKELPPGTKISAEVTALMQTMGTEFMRFASDEANERGTSQGRHSISASDLTASIEELDLEINSSMQQFSDLVLSRDSASSACEQLQTCPVSKCTTLSTQNPAQGP